MGKNRAKHYMHAMLSEKVYNFWREPSKVQQRKQLNSWENQRMNAIKENAGERSLLTILMTEFDASLMGIRLM